MTDNDKIFYHPETGEPLHLVPEGAKIPENMPYGYESGERFIWVSKGFYFDFTADVHTYFTSEPIRLPRPPLPTEIGSLIRATVENGDTYEVMALSQYGEWWGVNQDGFAWYWRPGQIVDWEPVCVVGGERIVTAEWIDRRRSLLEAATEGPWENFSPNPRFTPLHAINTIAPDPGSLRRRDDVCDPMRREDAEWIVDARTSLPLTLDALEAVLEVVRLHRREPAADGSVDEYDYVGALADEIEHIITEALTGGEHDG